MLEIGLAQVEQALTGHGGVLDPFFLREHGEDGLHEGRLAGGGAALDDDGKGFGEFSAGTGEIGG